MTSFYSPHIFACTNTRPADHPRGSCGGAGAEALRQYMREKLKEAGLTEARANVAGCLDQCENGPALVIYPEGVWYRAADKESIDRIIKEHLVGGKIVTDLQLTERIKR